MRYTSNIDEDFVILDNDIYESVVLHNKNPPPNNHKIPHFTEEPSMINDDYPVKNAKPLLAAGHRAPVDCPVAASSKTTCHPRPPLEWEHSYSTNFVQNVASTLVGTAKRVKSKKRDRSKSKESKRRDSSESRFALADFFRSPSGSRKSSLNSPLSGERKNSVTIKINDQDGLESSPENSIRMPIQQSQHKSRISKSPLRVLNKMRTWGSRDALDDKTVKVEYSVTENVISIPQLNRRDSGDQVSSNQVSGGQISVPRFLAANSREGIDFESLESELCNFDSEHSNDSTRSKSSLGPYHVGEATTTISQMHKRSPIAFDSDAPYVRLDHGLEMNSLLHHKSRSNEYLRSCIDGETSSGRSLQEGSGSSDHPSPRDNNYRSPKRSLPASPSIDHAGLCLSLTYEDLDVASTAKIFPAEQVPRKSDK